MLSRENRLTSQKDFEEIHRVGRFFSFGDILLKVKNNKLKATRFGFSIGIKFSPKAAERNRVKRQLRGILKKNIKIIKTGHDAVISLKKDAKKEISSDMLEQDLIAVLKKSKLL